MTCLLAIVLASKPLFLSFLYNGPLLSGQIKSFCISTEAWWVFCTEEPTSIYWIPQIPAPEGRDLAWTPQEHTGLAKKADPRHLLDSGGSSTTLWHEGGPWAEPTKPRWATQSREGWSTICEPERDSSEQSLNALDQRAPKKSLWIGHVLPRLP